MPKRILVDQYHINITTTHQLTPDEISKIESVFNGTIKRFSSLLLMQYPEKLYKKLKVQITK